MSWIGGSLTLPGLPEDEREGEAPADPALHLSLAICVFSDTVDGKMIATFGGAKGDYRQGDVLDRREPHPPGLARGRTGGGGSRRPFRRALCLTTNGH